MYCQGTQNKSSAIQLVLGDNKLADLDCESFIVQ